ncbi:HAD-like protein [Gonapodya prolifera JEL478]|uniref:HAD-like protein n=1 Tax=Gonapodya prolifera (strain JEL478) TaxID=1344416 RepID=A0A139AQH6_GONPJ|nr:HAD-like protein [Gonapodya prolifera JEL478]|eukprot:KXS18978.1 HAD-like protein [Gonapodya prolifera JEL478]
MRRDPKCLLVTFDAFGTLFTPRGGIGPHYHATCLAHGIQPPSPEAISKAFPAARQRLSALHPNFGFGSESVGVGPIYWWATLIRDTLIDAGLEPTKARGKKWNAVVRELYSGFQEADKYEVFPDVLSTLDTLHNSNFPTCLGVVSNMDNRLSTILENLALNKYFDFVLTSYKAGVEKPNAEIWARTLSIAEKMWGYDVPDVVAVHVGDDPEKDFRGSGDNGFIPFLLRRKESIMDTERKNGHVNSLTDVVAYLSKRGLILKREKL